MALRLLDAVTLIPGGPEIGVADAF